MTYLKKARLLSVKTKVDMDKDMDIQFNMGVVRQ